MPYKNSEKRKEKSRDAARSRRGKETEIYYQLSKQLPLPHGISAKLDKATITRLTISYLKIWKIFVETSKNSKKVSQTSRDADIEQLYPKALEGFCVIISQDGDIIYLSDTVAKYLGIQQIELMGHSVYDFSHPCDHDEIKDVLSMKAIKHKHYSADRVFFVRMKCTLTSKGRNINLKSASYKVIKFRGHLTMMQKPIIELPLEHDLVENFTYLVAIGETIPHPSNIEVPLDSKTFLSKHNMDMKFVYCDERIRDLIGYHPEELIGNSFYIYPHALDSEVVTKAFKNLFAKGQTMTEQYRLLAKCGGYVFVVTQATIIYNVRTQKAQCVVCVHFVLSEIEKPKEILAEAQLPTTTFLKSTESVFVPMDKMMNKDYYFPPGIESRTYADGTLDLTHLAPSAGGEPVALLLDQFEGKVSPVMDPQFPQSYPEKLSPVMSPDLPITIFKEEPGLDVPNRCCRQLCSFSSTSNSGSSTPNSGSLSPQDYNSPGVGDSELMDRFSQLQPPTKHHGSSPFNENLDDGVDWEARAPFIPPMTDDQSLGHLMPITEPLFNLPTELNSDIFFNTENVFVPKSVLKDSRHHDSMRDMLLARNATSSMEQPRPIMAHQIKRSLDMSALEKGPPVTKKYISSREKMKRDEAASIDAQNLQKSVLMNLLLTGEDHNHGYSMMNNRPDIMYPDKSLLRIANPSADAQTTTSVWTQAYQQNLLPCITALDCEVNAPIQKSRLLQGADLLHALDGMSSNAHDNFNVG
uniref:Hypoxia-inducible factor 1 n=1 Tax=Spathoderma californicum TaxID=3246909 RepID=A0AA96HDN0_9MOLL|nr:hypoxia-inducible factor 1 [Prochaetoderma californicum]